MFRISLGKDIELLKSRTRKECTVDMLMCRFEQGSGDLFVSYPLEVSRCQYTATGLTLIRLSPLAQTL